MMSKIVIDVSGYQDSSLSFFKTKKKQGASSAIVKLTEGTSYLNPKAGAQVANAYKVFGSVGAYHYFHGRGTAEAKYFLGWVKKMGLDKSTVLAIDVEDPGLPWSTTAQVNVFLRYLISHGYKNVVTYGPGSWFTSGRIKRPALVDKHIWVAAYGVSQPGVVDANAWQFSSSWHGIDASYDFDGTLSGTKTKAKKKSASYYSSSKMGLYEVTAGTIYAYKEKSFKTKRRVHFKKGSTFYATPVKYGKVYRLETKMGYFTANKSMVKLKMTL